MADSVYYYKPGGFKQFFRTITDKSLLVSDALAGFREIKCLPERLKDLTVEQVSDDPKLIAEIYRALRDGVQPESKYKLPYDKEERQKEIVVNIAEVYNIDRENTQCKVVTGIYRDDKTGQQFPYAVEIAIAPRKDLSVDNAGEVTFIGSVNDTPAIDGGERYFQSDLYVYKWTDRRGEHCKSTAKEVLAEFGFNTYWGTSRRRVPSVVLINVKTPVPDWLGAAGKTHINQVPYGETIARALCTMSYSIPSYRGQGYAMVYESSPSCSAQKSAEDYLDEFLIDRRKEVEANPSLRITDRLTQRGAWYRVRPIMVADGFEPRKNWGITGKSFADNIRDHCKQLWPDENITREYLGIFAKARGMFYYKGEKYPIEFDAIEELASKAAINIVIEKEGVPAVLEPYADKYGIALINSQGRFVDYVKDFVRAAMKYSVVVTLLDDDKLGREMAESTHAIKIGVNKETVLWLQQNGYPDLRLEDVQEEYSPDRYTREYRIEIDAILAKVKAEGLWKYIMYKLKELAPFDLTKAIDMPANEDIYPAEVRDILSYVSEYTDKILEDENQQIKRELEQVSELTDIKAKQDEIRQRLVAMIAKNPGMQHLQQKLGELLKDLRNAGS